ncbi:MAG: type II toxin-antitoxin system VapB family antitoxin [Devosia sp.]
MAKSTVFKTNRTQAVRIPKELAFPDSVKEVGIIRDGDRLLIVPRGGSWAEFFSNGPHVSEDFMKDRNQPGPQEREFFDSPVHA